MGVVLSATALFLWSRRNQDLSCTYLAHHELESVIIIIIITVIITIITITITTITIITITIRRNQQPAANTSHHEASDILPIQLHAAHALPCITRKLIGCCSHVSTLL